MSYSFKVDEKLITETLYLDTNKRSECKHLIKSVCGAPGNSKETWKRGRPVMEAIPGTIQKFVAIATFDKHGKLTRHAAIYVSHNHSGIVVYDQWVDKKTDENRMPELRTIKSYHNNQVVQDDSNPNVAENYYVVE